MKLKVALIIVDFNNKQSLKLKFKSRNEAFTALSENWHLSKEELIDLEINIQFITDNLHIYLIEW